MALRVRTGFPYLYLYTYFFSFYPLFTPFFTPQKVLGFLCVTRKSDLSLRVETF